jgi:hypothetical protein
MHYIGMAWESFNLTLREGLIPQIIHPESVALLHFVREYFTVDLNYFMQS